MNQVVPFRPKSPALRKAGAAHTRALGAHMHAIAFAGEAIGTTCQKITADAVTRRRAILWAAWKGRKAHGLPDDLTQWHATCTTAGTADWSYTVTFTPEGDLCRHWQAISVQVPAWSVAEEPGLVIEPEEAWEALPEDRGPPLALEAPTPPPAPAKAAKAPRKRGKSKTIMIMCKGRIQTLRVPAFLS